MHHRRFDAFARALGASLPRRRALGRLGAGLAAAMATPAVAATATTTAAAAQESGSPDSDQVQLASMPCACRGDDCQRCLIGLTGGGVVSTATGEAQLVLFASRLEVDADDPAAGFVRWLAPGEGDTTLTLESVGTIAYGLVDDDDQAREIRGTMTVNGAGAYPFALRAVDFGTAEVGRDTASIRVGSSLAEGSDFGYQEEGTIVGGDLQLLDTVGPIAAS